MSSKSRAKEVAPPPLEKIGDLVFSPGTDLPFGKRIRIGLSEQTIYESAVEKGYRTGFALTWLFSLTTRTWNRYLWMTSSLQW